MIAEHFDLILKISGVLTAGMVALFFFPEFVLKKAFSIEMNGNPALLFVRHWGILVFCFGLLLFWSASHPELKVPIVVAAIVEKLLLCICIFLSPLRTKPIALIIAGGDALLALVYGAYLLGY